MLRRKIRRIGGVLGIVGGLWLGILGRIVRWFAVVICRLHVRMCRYEHSALTVQMEERENKGKGSQFLRDM